MKNSTKLIVFILFSLFFSLNSKAQIYNGTTYQAVIRNASNALVANTVVGVKISVLQSTLSGTVVFSERQTPTTNINGLATFVIGEGTALVNSYFGINWLNGPYFIKTETDPIGGTNYTISGTSQINTVPYALWTENAYFATNSGDSWKRTGNIVDASTEFIGSTNNVNVVFKRNNIKAGFLGNNDNTAFGVQSLLNNNAAASNNSAFGSRALENNISGFNNTAVGVNALTNSNSNFNTAVGVASSFTNTTGAFNTSLGYFSLRRNSIGDGNVSIGSNSLENSLGYYNTALGYQSLIGTTGDQNTAVGYRSLDLLTTGGGNIGIGKIANVPSPTTNNQLSIGNVIYGTNMGNTTLGTVGIGVPSPTEKLEVAGKTKTTNLQVTAGAGVNKVLTSDAVGNATWQNISTMNSGFDILNASQVIPNNVYTKIDFATEQTDDANAFNLSTDELTILSTGFYHFELYALFNVIASNTQAYIRIEKNGSNFRNITKIISNNEPITLSLNFSLTAGDIITVKILQASGSSANLGLYNTNFSGFKVY